MREDYSVEENHSPVVGFRAHASTMPLDQATEPLPTIARGALTPPRLRAVAPTTTHRPAGVLIADLHFPAGLVQARAEEIAARARSVGAPHSLRLWRTGYEQALLSLSRAACGVDAGAPCESLFWEQRDDEFYVSVIFGTPAPVITH